jgi:hypothetical protein
MNRRVVPDDRKSEVPLDFTKSTNSLCIYVSALGAVTTSHRVSVPLKLSLLFLPLSAPTLQTSLLCIQHVTPLLHFLPLHPTPC